MRAARLDLEDDEFELWMEVPTAERGEAFADLSKLGEIIPTRLLGKAARSFASSIYQELRVLADPDELEVEFGISASGGAKFVIAAAGSVTITLRWKKRSGD